jgi:protocadherin Fat 4
VCFFFLFQVTDTNDNPPVFSEYVYSFDVDENEVRGTKVGQVSATDEDENVNGQISYTVISDWANDVFSLNPQTGIFTLTSKLDYEEVSEKKKKRPD